MRQLAVISGGLSAVQGIRTCWGRARDGRDNDKVQMMAFFAADF